MKRSKILLLLSILIISVLSLCTITACAKEFTVSFEGNGGFLVSGETTQIVNSSSKLNPPVFGRYGYEQDGWDIDPSTVKSDATLKAQWKVSTYKIIFDLNGGVETQVNAKEYTIESEDITLIAPKKTGFDFLGWTGTGLSSPTPEVVITKGSYGNKTYTANWTVKTYAISYNLKEGEFLQATPTSYTILSADQYIKNPVRTGYEFLGWSGTGISGLSKNVIITTGSYGDKEYTANWTPEKYQISFDLNGGKVNGSTTFDPIDVFYDTAVGVLPAPEIDGMIFDGWYYGEEKITSTTKYDKLEDIELVARYSDSYTIKFVLQSMVGSVQVDCLYDGKSTKEDVKVNRGEKLPELLDAEAHPKYSGQYDFDKWVYVNSNGVEIEITEDTVFDKNLFTHSVIYVIAKSKAAPWTPPITN